MSEVDPLRDLKRRADREPFARKLGIRVLELKPGYALTEMELGEDLTNIHGMAHGGALFSLIDAAFELASNSHGVTAVALNINVTFHKAPKVPGTLRAEAREVSVSKRIGSYLIEARDSAGELIASCQALVYRKA
ncbi:MAG: thioesterase [Deltaproteobacteria bacterium]|nr:MAG: thioesterase [Deltaproteobacteria bacterium]RLA99431.1 MAG: thioesterase [Deltaproteobacteria bacterium]